MKVLDTTFLIDNLAAVLPAKAYYEKNGGAGKLWIMPAPAAASTKL